MDNQIIYNLSSVPGFKNVIQNGEIPSDFEKYYIQEMNTDV